jgi:hypothetical protein
MEIIISLLMGTRLLTLLGGGVGHDAAAVAFLPPQLIIAHDEIRLNCRIVNAFPEELKKLIATATPVVMYLFIEVDENGESVKKVTVESKLVYDMIAKSFAVTQSSDKDTIRTASLDSAIDASNNFKRISLIPRTQIKRDARYSVAAFAVLGKTVVEALDNREIDCMYFWDFKRPSFKTEKIKGAQFLDSAP